MVVMAQLKSVIGVILGLFFIFIFSKFFGRGKIAGELAVDDPSLGAARDLCVDISSRGQSDYYETGTRADDDQASFLSRAYIISENPS